MGITSAEKNQSRSIHNNGVIRLTFYRSIDQKPTVSRSSFRQIAIRKNLVTGSLDFSNSVNFGLIPSFNIAMADIHPNLLIILDGWGHREASEDNAITMAKTPMWDNLWQNRPHCLISTSGSDVGLPPGQMGNSEVGHMSIGAGRVVVQDFTRINNAIVNGSFYANPALVATCQDIARTGKAVHIFGLLSPGGVHSHVDHINAAVKLAFDEGVKRVWVHAFLDGRDVPPKSAKVSLLETDAVIKENLPTDGQGGIASLVGRYYAMDRDNRWDRIELAYRLVSQGKSEFKANSAIEALEAAYDRGETDEFVLPTAISYHGTPVVMSDGDAVIFMNFRADRARQITSAFAGADFLGFDISSKPQLSTFVTLTEYSDDQNTPCAFERINLDNSLGELVSRTGLKQLRIAETEKYAHVTFFFSGGREEPFPNEDRLLIPSPKVATYDLQPAMSAVELTDKLIEAIKSKDYHLIVCNYANGDMVGHTGNLAAAIEAVECLDLCLTRVILALESVQGHCLITADHGNVEKMTDPSTGQVHTAHTTDKVPLIYIGDKAISLSETGGTLSDIAPTILGLMNLPQPPEMTGTSLIIDHHDSPSPL